MSKKRIDQHDKSYKERYKAQYDRHNAVRTLPELEPGDTVKLKLDNQKLWSSQGIVERTNRRRRTYQVRTSQGVYWRNRRHLLLTRRGSKLVDDSEVMQGAGNPVLLDKPMSKVIPDPVVQPNVPPGNTDVLKDRNISDCDNECSSELDSDRDRDLARSDNSITKSITTRSGRCVVKPKRFDDFV